MKDIKGLGLEELEFFLKKHSIPSFRARQIFSWIYKKQVKDFGEMSDLSLDLRTELAKEFYIRGMKLTKRQISKDKTIKLLLELQDKNLIEAVIIPAKGRLTGCVSSQVGCKFACGFCASGLAGFKRNLTSAEMLEEILWLRDYSRGRKLTHIVFMGMGEPLDNYAAVLKAIRIINSGYVFNIGARRITVSTCGIMPGIKRLADENLQIELSISLHASDDKTRSRLAPINKRYPLRDLIGACEEYIKRTGRQITFEYILIRGINSDLQNARKLSTMLKSLKLCKVNLIPCNPVKELRIEPPKRAEILLFRDYLIKQGVNVTLRKPRGQDIEGACGQLRLRHVKS